MRKCNAHVKIIFILDQVWWLTPLILALGKQRQVDLCEFKASVIYRVSSRTARDKQRNPISKKKKKINKIKWRVSKKGTQLWTST
jgi:hypothetical protein